MPVCEVVDCVEEPNKPGHTLCYEHWRANRDGLLSVCSSCNRFKSSTKPLCYPCFKGKQPLQEVDDDDELLSATDLGAEFDVSAQRINLMFAELGWIQREPTKGWTPTPQGIRFGAHAKEVRQSGIPYVMWASRVLNNPVVIAALRDVGEMMAPEIQTPTHSQVIQPAIPVATPSRPDVGRVTVPSTNFRDVHEAPYRTQDGHRVRSRAEMLIDDWLYMRGLVHAYEKSAPVEEADRMTGDFWLPQKRVWIEFWGMDTPGYLERKAAKKAIYAKYQFNLIEIGDEELKSLDDNLARLLRKFGVVVD